MLLHSGSARWPWLDFMGFKAVFEWRGFYCVKVDQRLGGVNSASCLPTLERLLGVQTFTLAPVGFSLVLRLDVILRHGAYSLY